MTRKITLRSSDGKLFMVDETVAMESQVIRHIIEDICTDINIPLPNVNSKILSKVLTYCKKHIKAGATAASPSSSAELQSWDDDFIKVDFATLLDLVEAADYLYINGLYDLTCKIVYGILDGSIFPRREFDYFA